MLEITDFFFDVSRALWALVVSNWVLSVGVLIAILNLVVSLFKGSTQD